jgi:syntaxin of plants SYP7
MRSTLRDTIRRLKSVRVKAGKNDDAEAQLKSTGDPFRDKNNEFIFCVKKAKEMIHERNSGVKKNGNDYVAIEESNNIRREIQKLSQILNDIKVMVDDAEQLVSKENRKKSPKPQKVQLLTRQYQERQSQYQQCSEMLDLVRKMDSERFEPKQQGRRMQPMEIGKTAKLREQLNLNNLRSRALRNQQSQAMAGGDEGEELSQTKTLEDDPETREQMRVLRSQENEINKGLDRLKNNVGRLHELAVEIGAHIDVQNAMIDKTEEAVDSSTEKLKALNRRLAKILKEQTPMNTFIYIACFALVLGLVGLLLAQANII